LGLPAHFIRRHPKRAPYPKPFKQTRCVCLAFLTLIRSIELSSLCSIKKAPHFVRGFVATLGASLDEFAGDVRAILDAKLKNF